MTGLKRIPTPYSYASAVVAGDFVFLGLHRGFGDDFVAQFEDAMRNLKNTLAQLDLPLESIVKIQVWLKHVEDLPTMEKLVADYFPTDESPARRTATTAFFDDDCLLMLEGIAYAGKPA